jgi:hypothetical protein
MAVTPDSELLLGLFLSSCFVEGVLGMMINKPFAGCHQYSW